MEASRAAVRTAKATTVTRGLNPLLDLGISALDPEMHQSITNIAIETKLQKAWSAG